MRWGVVSLPVLVMAACGGDDSGPDVTCGPGTRLYDGQCIPDSRDGDGGDDGVGSNGGAGGSSAGRAGSPAKAGTSNDGGADQNPGGTANGGNEPIGMGGEGGAPTVPEPEVLPTRWFVFRHQKGVFAYDTTKFPEGDGLLTLSDKAQGHSYYGVVWSPNGRTLLYLDQNNLTARELVDDVPGEPRLLVSTPAPPGGQLMFGAPWAWSADSKSIAIVTQTTLSVFDPSQAAPTLHPLTTSVTDYRWAPSGDRLLFVDAQGTHVVRVTSGVPGNPVTVDASATIWSPNGKQLVGAKDGDVALTTLSNDAASLQLLTDLNPDVDTGGGGAGGEGGSGPPQQPVNKADPYYMKFNNDGSRLTFSTSGEENAAFIVDITPSLGAPAYVFADASDGWSYCTGWSPDGEFLLCQASLDDAGAWFAAHAQGGDPISLAGFVAGDWQWSPNPATHQLFSNDYTVETRTIMVDLAQPNEAVKLYDGAVPFALSPIGDRLSYVVERKVQVVDLAAPKQLPAIIQTDQFAFYPPTATWSPNGRFISVTEDAFQQLLVRVDAGGVSTPVHLQTKSNVAVYGAWQP